MHRDLIDPLSSFPVVLASSFSLIGWAEIGDKSQVVCMALEARYTRRTWVFGLAECVIRVPGQGMVRSHSRPMATSHNAALGREGRALRPKIRV